MRLIAMPKCPYRPDRPMRCKYVSECFGKSKLMTTLTAWMSMPRVNKSTTQQPHFHLSTHTDPHINIAQTHTSTQHRPIHQPSTDPHINPAQTHTSTQHRPTHQHSSDPCINPAQTQPSTQLTDPDINIAQTHAST